MSVNLTGATVTFGRNTAREEACLAIFASIFRRLASEPGWTLPTPSPAGRTSQDLVNIAEDGGQAWLYVGFTKSQRFRIRLRINVVDQATNKATFDALAEHRDEIERSVGASLNWERAPHRRVSSVALYYPRSITYRSSELEIEELAAWVAEYVPRFEAAMRAHYLTITTWRP